MEESQAKKEKGVSRNNVMTICLVVFSIPMLVGMAFLNGTGYSETVKMVLILLLLDAVLIFYMKSSAMCFRIRGYQVPVVAGYLVSLALVLAMDFYDVHFLWLIGPLFVAAMVDTSLGLIYNLVFVFLLTGVLGDSMDQMAYRFVMGSIAVILAKYMTDLKNYTYVIIIAMSSNVTLTLILTSFLYREAVNEASMLDMLSIFAVLTLIFLIRRRFGHREPSYDREPAVNAAGSEGGSWPLTSGGETAAAGEEIVTDGVLAVNAAGTAEASREALTGEQELVAASRDALTAEQGRMAMTSVCDDEQPEMPDVEEMARLHLITESGFPLLVRLKEELPDVYQHSMKVGELSRQAAGVLGLSEELTLAGGFYHEIGKLVSKNYVKEGILLARQYEIPDCVIDIIKQHNLKVGTPRSPEAAIIVLSDGVANNMEYAEGGLISHKRLIDGILEDRLSKGDLDHSGLTLPQFRRLADFYRSLMPDGQEGDRN